MAGGGVKGGQILGHYPKPMSPDNLHWIARSRFIPTTPWEAGKSDLKSNGLPMNNDLHQLIRPSLFLSLEWNSSMDGCIGRCRFRFGST